MQHQGSKSQKPDTDRILIQTCGEEKKQNSTGRLFFKRVGTGRDVSLLFEEIKFRDIDLTCSVENVNSYFSGMSGSGNNGS